MNRAQQIAVAMCLWAATPATAFELSVAAPGDLASVIRSASLLGEAKARGTDSAQDVLGAARGDYARILAALYARGHYSGVIQIKLDGREASGIAPLDAPRSVRQVTISVDPGPQFRFSKAAIGPVAPETALPEGYRRGEVAASGVIVQAADAGVEGWRQVGHAKARVAGQEVEADHRAATLASSIALTPGPRVTFGTLNASGNQRLRLARLMAIAGFPTGEVFSPDKLDEVARRLRRTGIFRSVALTEAEALGPGNTLDVALTVVEEKPRRFGFGAEISSYEGLVLSGYWLHRNLFGGGERFRADARVSGLGGAQGPDYTLGARIDRPATFTANTTAWARIELARLDEPDYRVNQANIGFGLDHIFSDKLTGSVGLSYIASREWGPWGDYTYRAASVPMKLTYDGRDSTFEPTRGFYLAATATPFLGFSSTGSGTQATLDGRAYRKLGTRFTLAGRVRAGTVVGSTASQTPRDYLFFSGGGSTVRGQPYQSLSNPDLPGEGAMSFVGASLEARAKLRGKFGAVAFVDAGLVTADAAFGGTQDWHAGAGLGARYETGIGPLRVDVAMPVGKHSGSGPQFYIGIGQAF